MTEKIIIGQSEIQLVGQVEEKSILIKSLKYLPDFMQSTPVMKDVSLLLDALLKGADEVEQEIKELKQARIDANQSTDDIEEVDWSAMDEIYKAYCDIVYKYPGYDKLSYEAKKELIKEKGFEYVLDLLLHMYDDDYEQLKREAERNPDIIVPEYADYVKDKTSNTLVKLTMLFAIINALKGTTPGLELVLDVLDFPEYLYMPWDVCSTILGQITITDYNTFIPTQLKGPFKTGTTEPTWGNTYVTDGSIIWRKGNNVSYISDVWEPNKTYTENSSFIASYIVDGETNIVEYTCVAPKAGDTFYELVNDIRTYYIFNGYSWHACSNPDQFESPRERFTAQLIITGTSNEDLQISLFNFVRNYMLPYINVSLLKSDTFPVVYAFPSGAGQLNIGTVCQCFVDFNNVIDEETKKNLQHNVSDVWLNSTQDIDYDDIRIGNPLYGAYGLQGKVDLSNSYFKDETGRKHALYGRYQIIPEIIRGTALDKFTPANTITDYDGDYLETPLVRHGYVDVDMEIGNQVVPHYEYNEETGEYDKFVRDSIIKIFTQLNVQGLHLNKTIEQLTPNDPEVKGTVHVGDFNRLRTEVYAGRHTEISVSNNRFIYNFSQPETRLETGVEGPYNLLFTNAYIDNNKYTGIGDLGILGSNNYFIYNGMLLYNDNNYYKQVGTDTTWLDVGASHATSDKYYTPCINDGHLYCIKGEQLIDVERDPNIGLHYPHNQFPRDGLSIQEISDKTVQDLGKTRMYQFTEHMDVSYWEVAENCEWTAITGYINDNYTAFGICNGYLYKIYKNFLYDEEVGQPLLVFDLLDNESGWTFITGSHYSATYKAYGIKNGVLHIIDNEQVIKVLDEDSNVLSGWTSLNNHISRYHHDNQDFKSYGICNGNLYYISGGTAVLISPKDVINDVEYPWTDVCGYYDDKSPRTFAYAIKNGVLYEIQNTNVVVKNDTLYWNSITGSTNTQKTYILGVAMNIDNGVVEQDSGNLYKINAKTCQKLLPDNHRLNGKWTFVYGRYAESKAATTQCFAYGIRDNRYYIINKDLLDEDNNINPLSVSGMWKLNGQGNEVDLRDYNIEKLSIYIDGQLIQGQQEVKKYIPINDGDSSSNYDIAITYTTSGFMDNQRYNIRTQFESESYTYENPENCRFDVSLAHMTDPWNPATGVYNDLNDITVISHGLQPIKGNGQIDNFKTEETYLELPLLGNYSVNYKYYQYENPTGSWKQYGDYIFNKTPQSIQFIEDNGFLTNIEKDQPEYNSSVSRILDDYDQDTQKDITFLKTIRDTYNITVYTTETDQIRDQITEILIHFGCTGINDSLQPIILEENGLQGIYFGNYNDIIGIYGFDGTNYTLLKQLTQDVYEQAYCKFIKSADKFNVFFSSTNSNFTNINAYQINQPKYLGGNGTIYGNCTIYLSDCYIKNEYETKKLFNNGQYVSIKTQEQDLSIQFETINNQQEQKVLEVRKANNHLITQLDMNTIYVSRESNISNPNLTLEDTFTVNTINTDDFEQDTTLTLTYEGEFILDQTKAIPVGNIKDISHYNVDKIIDGFTGTDYVKLNPQNIDKLVITTNSEINQTQYLLQSEEDTIFTNSPILKSSIDGGYIGDNTIKVVPSGTIFEQNTDSAGVVTKELTYNSNAFEIDGDKLMNAELFEFDNYTAMLKFKGFTDDQQIYEDSEEYSSFVSGDACVIDVNMDTTNGATLIEQDTPINNGELKQGSINCLPNLYFQGSRLRQRIATFGDEDIIIGVGYYEQQTTIHWLDSEFNELETHPTYIEEEDTYYINETPLQLVGSMFVDSYIRYEYTDGENTYYNYSITQTVYVEPENPLVDFTTDKYYWMTLNVESHIDGLDNTLVTVKDEHTDPKDKLIWDNGKVSNIIPQNTLTVSDLKDSVGFVLSINTDDDASKDQMIFQITGQGSLWIKDNTYCWIDINNNIYTSNITVYEDEEAFFALRNLIDDNDSYMHTWPQNRQTLDVCKIYYSSDDEEYIPLFTNVQPQFTQNTKLIIGYDEASENMYPFKGYVDLTQTYIETLIQTDTQIDVETEEEIPLYDINKNRLFKIRQITKVLISEDKQNYTQLYEFTHNHSVKELYFGYDYIGSLDLYESDLLQPYVLQWLDEGQPINDLEDYGVQLTAHTIPQRWDTIWVTYTTVDEAFYLQPNTTYNLKLDYELDEESGHNLITTNGNATWKNGILSNVSTTDIYTTSLDSQDYIVINFKLNSIQNQGICGYDLQMEDTTAKSILVYDENLQYWDGEQLNDLGSHVEPNVEYFVKLYTSQNNIEYKVADNDWVQTNVDAAFTNYSTFVFGKGHYNNDFYTLDGQIDFKQSYIYNEQQTDYLYTPYRKITPYISTDDETYTKIGVLPLLTTKDFVDFGVQFDGSLNTELSNLLLPDTTYWIGNKIEIRDENDVLVRTLIRDDINLPNMVNMNNQNISNTSWTKTITQIKINPEDLKLFVTGKPALGDTILCEYYNKYLFSDTNSIYKFNVEYDENNCYISHNKQGENKYIILTLNKQNYIINAGFEFSGTLNIKDSTRGGQKLCDYYRWDTYSILYKIHDEENWLEWTRFTVDQNSSLCYRCGYDLNGTHYLETSMLKYNDLITPFIAHYNCNYIEVHDAVLIEEGIASQFSDTSYIKFIPQVIKDGCMVELLFTLDSTVNQGICTNLHINDGYFYYDHEPFTRILNAKPNYTYCIQYLFENGKVKIKLVSRHFENYRRIYSPIRHLIAIPYNAGVDSTSDGYYITTESQAQQINVSYRTKAMHKNWDKYLNRGTAQWYDTQLKLMDTVEYMGQTLHNVYVLDLTVGFDDIYIVPDGHGGQTIYDYEPGDVTVEKLNNMELVELNSTYISEFAYHEDYGDVTQEYINGNPDGYMYITGDILEVRMERNGKATFFDLVMYTDLIYKHRIRN